MIHCSTEWSRQTGSLHSPAPADHNRLLTGWLSEWRDCCWMAGQRGESDVAGRHDRQQWHKVRLVMFFSTAHSIQTQRTCCSAHLQTDMCQVPGHAANNMALCHYRTSSHAQVGFFYYYRQVLLMFRLMIHSSTVLPEAVAGLFRTVRHVYWQLYICTKHNCVISLLLLFWTAPFSGHCCCITRFVVHLLHTFRSLFIHKTFI